MNAIVFNCDYNGLSIIQELGRHNVKVIALDNIRAIGTFSKYAKFIKCPNPQIAEELFIDFLLKLHTKLNARAVLFPTNDHWAYSISKYKNEMSKYYSVCVADYSVIELLIKKKKF
mgnify:CR=1 FL=1